jgi:small-conductance mechanosensitive channel
MEAWEALVSGATWEPLLLPLAVAAAGWLVCAFALWLLAGVSRRADSDFGQWLLVFLRRPLGLLVATLLFRLMLPVMALSGGQAEAIRHILAILLILGIGWLLVALTSVLDQFVHKRFVLAIPDNLMARRVHTRFVVLRRVLVIVIGVVTAGALLMTFPAIRQLGAGLLASAGIAGLVLGIAARPTVELLIAGVQLALTEPIRLDDVVIVEGEWGRIEQINATHVVVRIWDDRRLIVPVSYFLTQPFQNWTRVTADITGQVTLEVDYATPIEKVRAAAGRIVEASAHWDRRFWNLQVVEAGERTIRLRVLASAGDASSAWDLRCEIREKLIGFLQERHPEALPRFRASLTGGPVPEPARSAREIATQASANEDESEV